MKDLRDLLSEYTHISSPNHTRVCFRRCCLRIINAHVVCARLQAQVDALVKRSLEDREEAVVAKVLLLYMD